MFRRDFLSSLPMLPALAHGQGVATGTETPPSVYEWRQYSLRTGANPGRLGDYLQTALIPALNRLGHTPIGVFQVTFGLPAPTVFVLTPSTAAGGADSLLGREAKLDRDDSYTKAAAPYLDAVATDPVYVRQEVSLLSAFPQFPHISVPAATATKGPRLFELRIYESHNERAHRAKVKMFAEVGEIDIFKRAGLPRVFFSRTIAGPGMPGLSTCWCTRTWRPAKRAGGRSAAIPSGASWRRPPDTRIPRSSRTSRRSSCVRWRIRKCEAVSRTMGTRARVASACGGGCAVWLTAVALAAGGQARVDFKTQIQPIIARDCLECHGQDRRKGGLSLATYGDALDGGRNGAVIRPGNGARSPLIHRLTGALDPQMPKDADPLRPADIALIQ